MIFPMDYSELMEGEIPRKSKTYVVHGDPVPLARPRFVVDQPPTMDLRIKNPAKARVYDSQKGIKADIAWDLKKQHGKEPKFEGPLYIEFRFYLKGENSWNYGWHATRPDLSNLIKMYEDVGSGILYHDDAQISSIKATKEYASGEKRTEITIYQLEESNGIKRTQEKRGRPKKTRSEDI